MAKKNKPEQSANEPNNEPVPAGNTRQEGRQSIAGYFRGLFEANPRLLNERSNAPLLAQWRADHPGEQVTASVKAGLANVKGLLRSKRRKKTARTTTTEQRKQETQSGMPSQQRKPQTRGLAKLEEALDECLTMAKATDREGLDVVIGLLRRARTRSSGRWASPSEVTVLGTAGCLWDTRPISHSELLADGRQIKRME